MRRSLLATLILLAFGMAMIAAACAPAAPQATPTPAPAAKPTEAAKPAAVAATPTEVPKPAATPTTQPAEAPKPAATATKPAGAAVPLKPLDPPLTPPVKVKALVTMSASSIGFWAALDLGYFKEAGLDVTMDTALVLGGETIPTLSTNRAEAGAELTGASLFNALGRGTGVKIVGQQGSHFEGASAGQIFIRKDLWDSGKFKEAKDLKGLSIGVSGMGGSTEVAIEKMLKTGGLAQSDVKIIPLDWPSQMAALANKSIDVAHLSEPFATQANETGLAVRWQLLYAFYPNQTTTVVLYSPEFAKTEAAKRFMLAYLKGIRDYNDGFRKKIPEKFNQIVAVLTKNTAIKDPQMYAKMVPSGLDPDGQLNVKGMNDDQDWYVAKGLVPAKANLDQAIDMSFANYALERLGKY